MNRRQLDPVKIIVADLDQECTPHLEKFLRERGELGPDDATLARVAEEHLRNSPLAQQYALSGMAVLVTSHFINRTDRDNLTSRQLTLLSVEEVRSLARHSIHRPGDGTTILQSFMTPLQVEARQERRRKNRLAVDTACDEGEVMTKAVLRYMAQGQSYEDALVSFREELLGER